jgi:uncharacterized BrkB/YihY/UPF0761 family membrane protein
MMVWVYYSAQVFLLGAEFTRLAAEERTQDDFRRHGRAAAPG